MWCGKCKRNIFVAATLADTFPTASNFSLVLCIYSEIGLIIIGFIFVIETVSVILQVGSFKLRQKRIFLMAPIHHHFEEKGWKENKIIVRFWIISFMANLVALMSLKIR